MNENDIYWLMDKIAEELINERLDIPPTVQNITKLARLLNNFESEVLATAKHVSEGRAEKKEGDWPTNFSHQLPTPIKDSMRV